MDSASVRTVSSSSTHKTSTTGNILPHFPRKNGKATANGAPLRQGGVNACPGGFVFPRRCVAAVLLSATKVASAQLANSYPWCASDRGRTDVPSCYYNDGKLCWVTMSGIGVCVPYFPPQA